MDVTVICTWRAYFSSDLDGVRHDRKVVGFTTTYAIRAHRHLRCKFESHSCQVYLIQHYVIKFVS